MTSSAIPEGMFHNRKPAFLALYKGKKVGMFSDHGSVTYWVHLYLSMDPEVFASMNEAKDYIDAEIAYWQWHDVDRYAEPEVQ